MDKIGDIVQIPVPGKSEEQSLSKVSLPTWQQEIVARYKTGEEILSLFNPSHQTEYTQNEMRCFTGHAPSIARLSRTFGENIAESWLSIQLFDLAEFTQVLNGMETKDFIELARIIINGYGDFKLTEFMVFFQNFKKGQYGTFYGRFDPQTVTRSLRQFKAEREEILGKYADAKAAEERKREKQRWEQEKATPEQIEEIINKHFKKEAEE